LERYLKVEDAANKSEELRKTITLIQDAETRIKQVIFHSFLTQDHVEATIVRIIEETVKDLPENADKDKYAEDLKSNANHWLVIVKHSGMVLDALGTGTPRVLMPTDKAEYKQIAALFERGQPREANYQQEVLRLTKTIAKEMAGTSFKSSTVDYKGLTMRTNISLRAAAERRIRDQIHHDDNARVIAENVLVWISGHVDCSDRCEPWQSKLYSTNGKTGTIEGHKYIPLETAINSNWVTTKAGKRWNNSILEGFNCRHYTIPFVPGTVPVIKYDPKIVARERAITARMRKMERDIITGKTLHRLLVEAERDNKLNLPKHAISDTKRQVVEMYRQMNEQYQAYCKENDRAYYPWRTQIQVDRQEAEKAVDEKVIAIDLKYKSIYNDDGKTFKATTFLNNKKLERHIKKHLSDFPGVKSENYEKYARAFLSQKVDGEEILGFTNENGFVFRYDRQKNIFATAKPDGTIETFFKPKDGLLYWEGELNKYGRTKS
jgi:transposase-like protein